MRSRSTCGFLSFLIVTTLVLLPGSLEADSIFAAHSFGIPVTPLDGRSWSMAGVSAALGGENFSTTNPALVANFYRSGFTGMLIPEYRRPEDGEGSVNLRHYNIPVARAVFPLRKRFVASAGVKHEFDMNWRFDGEREFLGDNLSEYLTNEGSLYAISASVARSFRRRFAIGAEFEFHRGEQTRTWLLDPPPSDEESGGPGIGSRDIVKSKFSGESVTMGILVHPARWLDAGLSWRPGYRLSVDENLEAGNGYKEENKSYIDMPQRLIFGVSVKAGKRLVCGFDLETSFWGDARFSDPFPFPLNNYKRYSLGLEFTPSRDPLAPFWKKWPLRMGLMFRTLPSQVNGESVKEISFVSGVGMNLGDGRGRIDFFTQYMKRGKLETLGVKERVILFGVSVSGFEKWIPKRKGRPI